MQKKLGMVKVLFMLCMMCMFSITAQAKGKTEVEKRLASVQKEYPNKSTFNSWVGVNGSSAGGCNALVMYTTLRVFHNAYTPDCSTYKHVGKSASTNNQAAMKQLFQKAKVGDVVRFRRGGTDAHYAIYFSYTSAGMYLYESNFGGKDKVRNKNFWSWSVMKSWPTGGATKVDMYRSKNYNKVNQKKSAKLYKKGDKIEVDNIIYQVTKVSGFGGEVKVLGFEEGAYQNYVTVPGYIYVDNMSEKNLNCNYHNSYGDDKKSGVGYQMIYKVTAIGNNAFDVIDDDNNAEDDDNYEDYEWCTCEGVRGFGSNTEYLLLSFSSV